MQRSCYDRNECNHQNGGCDHTCKNKYGGYQCYCNDGYYLNPNDDKTCTDIDECECEQYTDELVAAIKIFIFDYKCTSNGGCSQICHNFNGGYECQCEAGYQLTSDGKTCKDINECTSSNKVCEYVCKNTIGSYECSCRNGQQLADDNHSCEDENECETGNHKCISPAYCSNTDGSYICQCPDGYNRIGKKCIDIDECRDPSANDCRSDAKCYNYDGGYNCDCPNGYELAADNHNCIDKDECASTEPACEGPGYCTNTQGSYQCKCPPGYREANKKCFDINECIINENYCLHQSNCINTKGSFYCDCDNTGYSGDRCQDYCGAACLPLPTATVTISTSVTDSVTTISDDSNAPGFWENLHLTIILIGIFVILLLIVGIVVTVLYKKKKLCFEPKRPKRESYGVGIIRTESRKSESIFN